MPGKQIVTPPENAAHDNVTRQVLLRKLLTHSKQICHKQLHHIQQTLFDGADDTLLMTYPLMDRALSSVLTTLIPKSK